MFVNLWGDRVGRPLTYATVNDVVLATRRTVGFHFTPHWFRHTYATLHRRAGVPLEVVSQLIMHRSVQTTQQIYTHLDVEDLDRAHVPLADLPQRSRRGDRQAAVEQEPHDLPLGLQFGDVAGEEDPVDRVELERCPLPQ
jgi:Phage integrase family